MLVLLLTGCAPRVQQPQPDQGRAQLTRAAFITPDGARLPLHHWPAAGEPQRILLAVHGFNDYGAFVEGLATFLAPLGVTTYAYDQRGFGAAPQPGIWGGRKQMEQDLRQLVQALHARYPARPLFLLGESMGGALVLRTLAAWPEAPVAGAILSAPAVWGPSTWPWYQRWTLYLGAHLVPWLELTGEGLEIEPSDNHAMLRQLGRDPWVIKQTRLDSLWGLSRLMEDALRAASDFKAPALILYGARDELIPWPATRQLLERLPEAQRQDQRFALYPEGYHMLTRDLQAERVWRDIASWIRDPQRSLPSKADRRSRERLSNR